LDPGMPAATGGTSGGLLFLDEGEDVFRLQEELRLKGNQRLGSTTRGDGTGSRGSALTAGRGGLFSSGRGPKKYADTPLGKIGEIQWTTSLLKTGLRLEAGDPDPKLSGTSSPISPPKGSTKAKSAGKISRGAGAAGAAGATGAGRAMAATPQQKAVPLSRQGPAADRPIVIPKAATLQAGF
jgi:hypothetical protein